MRVAILGARGIPARYSGYDTLVEELATRMVTAGDAVRVYCRRGYYRERPREWRGVRLVHLPTFHAKGLESLLHSGLSTLHALVRPVDLVYFLDPANAPFVLLLRLFRRRVVVHTDGLGWQRRKWGPLARWYYRRVEWVCARLATALVADNPGMVEYYAERYGRRPCHLAYGAACGSAPDRGVLKQLGLVPGGYLLVVARLERENNTDLIIREYGRSGVELPLVVVGDSPYAPTYERELREAAGPGVRFLGRIHDQGELNGLLAGCRAYLHGHEVGGTNPSLLRAMGAGAPPVVLDVVFNRAVIGECGWCFTREQGSLAEVLRGVVDDPAGLARQGERARERAEREYTWERVVEGHRRLFAEVVGE